MIDHDCTVHLASLSLSSKRRGKNSISTPMSMRSWTRVRAACTSSAEAVGASLQVNRKIRQSNCALRGLSIRMHRL